MKILYDHQMFSMQKYGGITKYFCELMKNLPKEHHFELSVLLSDNQYLRENKKKFGKFILPLPEKDTRVKLILKKKLYKLNEMYSKYVLETGKFDLFHPTYFDLYFIKRLNKPFIVTIHDLIRFKFKELFPNDSLMQAMQEIIRKADRFISISENTKADLIELFNIPPDKIDVIYHGYNNLNNSKNQNPFGNYILYVGRRGGYKNFEIFAQAMSVLLNKHKDIKLICVGDPFKNKELCMLKSLRMLDKSIAIGVNEEQLSNLYSNALVFVYPTLYEGFGMPILEAFANDCPVCLSKTSSLPEVAGNAGVYFEPTNHDSILDAVERVIFDKSFSQNLVKSGKKRLKIFSWENCAEQTVESYKKTLQ